jgi:hypothetical protein
MTQDTVNEAQAIRELLHREEQKKQAIIDSHLQRIMELRHLIDNMVEEVPTLRRKFKEEIDRLND